MSLRILIGTFILGGFFGTMAIQHIIAWLCLWAVCESIKDGRKPAS